MTAPAKAPASLAEALAALQAQMPPVGKHNTADVKNKDGRKLYDYAYAAGEDITAKLYPVMAPLGLSFTAAPTMNGHGFVLEYALLHASGEQRGPYCYPLPDPAKYGPQDLGKAETYARRYALCAVTGLFPGGDDTDATSGGQPIAAPARKSRAVPDSELRGGGRMTRAEAAAHDRLKADTLKGGGKAERTRPSEPDPGDPWAADEPVTHQRAAAMREHLDRREQDPEDRPGSIMPGQHRAIEAQLGMLGFKPSERKDRHAHAALRLGLGTLPNGPAGDAPSMLGLSAAQAAALIRALQDDLDDLKKADTHA